MRAVSLTSKGLSLETVPVPQPAPDEVLIRVRASAMNHLDLWTRRRKTSGNDDAPLIPGSDIAGVVEAVGEVVAGVQVGASVVVSPGLSCRRCSACHRGDESLCPDYGIIGARDGANGGYAQYATVPGRNVLPKPENLSFVEAAALPLVYMTAWHMLVHYARVQPGERVLIVGATGGVGTAAIQIARLYGAHVIGTAGDPGKAEKLRTLGVDEVILYHNESVEKRCHDWTYGVGVDIAIETVGAATWSESLASLRRGGRLVICGATTGPDGSTELRRVFANQLRISGSYMGRIDELQAVLAFAEQGQLRPVVDRVFPLAQATEAYRYLEESRGVGKVVIEP